MMLSAKLDPTQAVRKLQTAAANCPQARNLAVAVASAAVARKCSELARVKRDTGRFQRGFEQAHNDVLSLVPEASDAAGGPMALTALSDSKFSRRIFPALHTQRRRFQRFDEEARAELAREMMRPKPNRARVRAGEKRVAKIAEVLDRIDAQFEAINSSGDDYKRAITIGGRRTKRIGVSNVSTVFLKTYGGRARFVGPGLIELRNLEPHARIVDRRNGITRAAVWSVRGSGVGKVRGAYLAKMAKGTGIAVRGGAST